MRIRSRLRRRSTALTGVVMLALLESGCGPASSSWSPPDSRRDPVVDVLHGEEIVDDYRWLEDQESAATRDWIERQNAFADLVLEPAEAYRGAFRERLTTLIDIADVGEPRQAGTHQVFTLRRVGEPVARIVRRPAVGDGVASGSAADGALPDASPGDAAPDPTLEYEVLVDPLAMRDDGTVSVRILSISPDDRVMLYSVRDGGPDEIEIRAFDLHADAELPDRLPTALYGGSFLWNVEADSFLYVHRSRDVGPRARVHRLGTDPSADVEVFGSGIGPQQFISASRIADDSQLLFHVNHGWQRHDLYIAPLTDDRLTLAGSVRPLAEGVNAHFEPRFIDDTLYVLTDYEAPLGRWMAVDTAASGPQQWREVIAEGSQVLRQVLPAGDGWATSTFEDATSRVNLLDADGRHVREVAVQPLSTATLSGGGDAPVRVRATSFVMPSTEYELDLDSGELVVHELPGVELDGAAYDVSQRWATSRDGTRVPYFVVHLPGVDLDGSNRTLLNGYGGFRAALTPRFSPAAVAWVEAGGVWAHGILRGGTELGEEWHRDGRLENKQNVFDDFIAIGEDLIAIGFTSPEHLAIRGGSNGGLLVGSALTQRPDLFAAVLCGVPDLDMVRFFTFEQTNNEPALLEYGNAALPEQFAFLRRYSPYQAVRDRTPYPAVLISTGDLDTRVSPLQGRKMTARLQAATSSDRPVILRYDPRRGHAGGRTVQRSIDDTAAELAFVWWQLGER